jgi:Tfp pilus assembly protein PilX
MKQRARMRSNDGMALPIALGIMMVLGIAVVTVLGFTSSSQRHAEVSNAEQVAVDGAEAGLNHAESVLANAADPDNVGALPSSSSPGSVPIQGGTAQYWGSLDSSVTPHRWTVSAASTIPNPTGGAALSHTVTAQFDVTVPIAGNEAWNYVFSDAPGCTYYQNNVTVGAPVYTKGDLCIKNGSALLGPQVDSYGAIQLENSGRVGTSPSEASDPAVRTRLGCRNSSSPPESLPCSDATYEVYRSSFSNSPPNLTKQPFDASKRTGAKPGPNQYCTQGSFPGGPGAFTSTGAFDLMPNSSYMCRVWSSPPSSGTLLGELSWDDTAKVLTVKGTIWFDGELVMSSNQEGTYNGTATIYVAKKVNFANYTELCALPDCPMSGWDPNTEILFISTAAADVPAFELNNFAKFQGGVYAVGGFKLQNNGEMHGPVVAGVVDVLNNGMPASWPPLTSLPDGVPSNVGKAAILVPGSWRG